jgi:hypothetical protein
MCRCTGRSKTPRDRTGDLTKLANFGAPGNMPILACHIFCCVEASPACRRYFDPLPVHPSVLVGEKRSNHRPLVIRHASASKSRHIGDALVNLRVVPHHAAAEVGRNLCV